MWTSNFFFFFSINFLFLHVLLRVVVALVRTERRFCLDLQLVGLNIYFLICLQITCFGKDIKFVPNKRFTNINQNS